jgi:uncharacterized protein DUF4349/putative zinc finger protein
MNPNSHPYDPETVMAYFDGEIPSSEAAAIAAHTDHCADCASLVAKFHFVSQSADAWRVEALSPHTANSSTLREKAERFAFFRGALAIFRPHRRALFATVAVGAFFLLVFAIAVPNLLKSKMAANEASAVGSLRTLNAASAEYVGTFGHLPPSLESLQAPGIGRPHADAADLIDKALASGSKSGYHYVYRPLGNRYTITAEPIDASAGTRIFSTDDTGVILSNGRPLGGEIVMGDKLLVERISKEVAEPSHVAMIARTVDLSVVVKDFAHSRKSLDSLLQRHRGYAAQLTISGDTASRGSLQASLRIPVSELDAALTELKSLGLVQRESLSGEEVTMQHADLAARISNARETEARLNEILRTRTGKVADVLEVEQEVSQTRGQIEQMESELKTLETRVDFATISLSISEEVKEQVGGLSPSAATQIRNASVSGLRDLRDSSISLAVWVLSVGPLVIFWVLLLGSPAFWILRRWRIHKSFSIGI